MATLSPPRSAAKERRLRKQRSDARIRLRIAADASLLADHHASAVPMVGSGSDCTGLRIVHLLETLVSQHVALSGAISSFIGWQSGQSGCCGAFSPCAFAPGAAAHFVSGPAAAENPVIPSDSLDTKCDSHSGAQAVVAPIAVATFAEQMDDSGVGAVLPSVHSSVGIATGSVGITTSGEGHMTYQQFIASDYYADLCGGPIFQKEFLDSYRDGGFPADWNIWDVLARVCAKDPHDSDLHGFIDKDFHLLNMFRTGQVDSQQCVQLQQKNDKEFDMCKFCDLSATQKDSLFVSIIRQLR